MTNKLTNDLYMRRALELAQLGRGHVSPNPMVGCVIVHNNQVISEGWHKKYGDWHAEVNAVHSVQDLDLLKRLMDLLPEKISIPSGSVMIFPEPWYINGVQKKMPLW